MNQDWKTLPLPLKQKLLVKARARLFRLTYADDPIAFAHDCIIWPEGEGPTDYQDRILQATVDHQKVSVRGPHGLGKTCPAAIRILHHALTRDGDVDWKVATTAGGWHQLTHYLWPEVHKWARMLNWSKLQRSPFKVGDELLDLRLDLTTGEAFAAASNNPAMIEGAHADSMGYVYDESKVIPDETWDASEGAFAGAGSDTGREAWALSLSTPGDPSGRFWRIQEKHQGFTDWYVIHVTLEEAVAAGRISAEWADKRREQWGEDSSEYQNRVLGNFASQQYAVIPRAWVDAAMTRWDELHKHGRLTEAPFTGVGADIADTGADESILAHRYGDVIAELEVVMGGGRGVDGPNYGEGTAAATGAIVRVLNNRGKGRAMVDALGPGASVVGDVREQTSRARVVAFAAWSPTDWSDDSGELLFDNVRAASWWALRQGLAPGSGRDIALPRDEMMAEELTSVRRLPDTKRGKIRLEDKDNVRARIGRSPDRADAVVMAYWLDTQSSIATLTGRQIRDYSV